MAEKFKSKLTKNALFILTFVLGIAVIFFGLIMIMLKDVAELPEFTTVGVISISIGGVLFIISFILPAVIHLSDYDIQYYNLYLQSRNKKVVENSSPTYGQKWSYLIAYPYIKQAEMQSGGYTPSGGTNTNLYNQSNIHSAAGEGYKIDDREDRF